MAFSALKSIALEGIFFIYRPSNFALLLPQKTLEQSLARSYNPTNLKRETLPVLGR